MKYQKRLIAITAAVLALVVAVPGAMAASGTGSLQVGHPGTAIGTAATELDFKRNQCSPSATTLKGLDGYIIDVSGFQYVKVVGEANPVPYGLNLVFFSSNCDYIGTPISKYTTSTSVTSSTGGAKWVVVSASYGARINFSWTTFNA